jgi:uncharacterized protein (TIGR02266 family)
MGMEQREFERIPTDFLVTVTIRESELSLEGSSLNLSRGGMFIGMEDPLPKGTRVKLLLHMETQGETVLADATVAWTRPPTPDRSRPPGIGVKFGELNQETLQAIDRAVERPSGK